MRKIVMLALAMMAILPAACSTSPQNEPGGGTSSGRTARHTVAFEITGDGVSRASLTYTVGMRSVRETGVDLPWRKSIDTNDTVTVATVTAQSASGTTGSIACRITIDGQQKVSNTSPGAFPSVTCTAT